LITQEELEAYEDSTWTDILRPFVVSSNFKELGINTGSAAVVISRFVPQEISLHMIAR
jgi:hypothetical protein